MDADLTPNTGAGTERLAVGLRPQPLHDPEQRAHKAALAEALFGVTAEVVRIGRFRVHARLGEGGMGVVYAGHDEELDRRVAIKLLHADGDEFSESRARLLREAQALARLSHPNVVQLFEVGEHHGRLYVAMEQVLGQTLHAWLRAHAGPRPWREVLEVFLAAGRGLAAAHEVGLVHRDFKPGNVMLGDDGRVRVLDFGLARAQAAASAAPPTAAASPTSGAPPSLLGAPLTMTGGVVGTPAYMAPEQLQAQHGDPRSDQFSFCVALFEALYGARPHAGASQAELLTAISRGQIRRPPAGTRVPAWLHATVLRGLARDPAARWPSMPALLAELVRDRDARRRRFTLAAVIAGLAVIPLGIGVVAGARQLEHSARLAACEASGAEISEVWNTGARARLFARLGPHAPPQAAESLADAASTLAAGAERWRERRIEGCMAEPEGYVHPAHLLERQERVDRCFAEARDDLQIHLDVALSVDPIHAGLIEQIETFRGVPCLEKSVQYGVEYPADPAARAAWQALRAAITRARLAVAAGDPGAAEAVLVGTVAEARARGFKKPTISAMQALTRARFAAGHRRAAWASFEAGLAYSTETIEEGLDDTFDPIKLQLALGATSGKPRHVTALLLQTRGERPTLAEAESLVGVLDRAVRPFWRHEFPTLRGWIARAMLPAISASAQLMIGLGDLEGAEEYARNGLAVLGFHHDDPGLAVDLELVLAAADAGLGRHARAAETLQHALARASGPDPAARARLPQVRLALADLALARGDLDGATRELARAGALADAAAIDDDRFVPTLTLLTGRLHAARGDLDGAERQLQRARTMLTASHGVARRLYIASELELAALALARGDLDAAATRVDAALQANTALVGEAHVSHAPILALQARVQRAQGQDALADATLARARGSITHRVVAPELRAALAE